MSSKKFYYYHYSVVTYPEMYAMYLKKKATANPELRLPQLNGKIRVKRLCGDY